MTSLLIRRCLAEFVGTFAIVFAPVALSGAKTLTGADNSLAAASWISGLIVLSMIYALGHVCSAHFNPAVTLAFAFVKRFPARYVPHYIGSQLAGGIVAAGVCAFLFGAGHGVHIPGIDSFRAFVMEVLLSFLLMLVIISVATDKRAAGGFPGVAIGLVVVVDVWIGGAVTGGSMNPARSLGPALFGGSVPLSHLWIYLSAPVLGAVFASRLYEVLRGGEEHAQSAPTDWK